MEKIKKYRDIGLLAVICLVVVGALGFFLMQMKASETEPTAAQLLAQSADSTTAPPEKGQEQAAKTIIVDIKGQVQKPGVYELAANSRLNELVKMAGGLTGEANDRELNQALVLADQQLVYVPHKDEASQPTPSANVSGPGATNTEMININTADQGELQQLSGIGEKKAQAIIQYREENGGFKNVDELTEVSGIGEKTLEKLKSSVTI